MAASEKGKPIRNFSIDPTSSIRTPIADAIFVDAISETPIGVPHAHLSRPLVYACFNRSGRKGAFRPPEATGEPSPRKVMSLIF